MLSFLFTSQSPSQPFAFSIRIFILEFLVKTSYFLPLSVFDTISPGFQLVRAKTTDEMYLCLSVSSTFVTFNHFHICGVVAWQIMSSFLPLLGDLVIYTIIKGTTSLETYAATLFIRTWKRHSCLCWREQGLATGTANSILALICFKDKWTFPSIPNY